jgi:hypothetical protein
MRIKTISAGDYDAKTQVLTLKGKTASGDHISVKIELDDVAQFAEIFASLALRTGASPALIASDVTLQMFDDDDGTTLLCAFELKTGNAFRIAIPMRVASQTRRDEIERHLAEIASLLGKSASRPLH